MTSSFNYFDNPPPSSGIDSPADLPTTRPPVEPSADQLEAANTLGGFYVAYQRAGFPPMQAYGLVQTLLAATLTR